MCIYVQVHIYNVYICTREGSKVAGLPRNNDVQGLYDTYTFFLTVFMNKNGFEHRFVNFFKTLIYGFHHFLITNKILATLFFLIRKQILVAES